jgi:hypothetical protein
VFINTSRQDFIITAPKKDIRLKNRIRKTAYKLGDEEKIAKYIQVICPCCADTFDTVTSLKKHIATSWLCEISPSNLHNSTSLLLSNLDEINSPPNVYEDKLARESLEYTDFPPRQFQCQYCEHSGFLNEAAII